MKPDEILAKSDPGAQSLIDHTNDCLFWLGKALTWKSNLINLICRHHKIDKDLLVRRLFMTVAFHDIGKANQAFQNKIRKSGKREQESHPLASVPFIFFHTQDAPILEDDDTGFFPETLAVVSHHNKLYPNVYGDFKGFQPKWTTITYFQEFYENLNRKALEMQVPGWQPLIFDSKILSERPYHNFSDSFLPAQELRHLKTKIRDLFLLFKGILHYADWIASSRETNFDYSTPIGLAEIQLRFAAQLLEKDVVFEKWQPFQEESAKSPGHIFVQIPTGQGKTEASLLWAVNQNRSQKIIYLLPTQVTTNKIHKRLQDFFGQKNLGLSHGAAQFVIKDEYEYEEDWAFRKDRLLNRTFFKAVTVATVDQLIYSFFNWGHWVLTGAASFNARIVIDEIHLYDGYTFGLILKTIEHIVPYHSQFAIMSASLPEVMRTEIERLLPENSWKDIRDSVFDEKQRHRLQTGDCQIEALLPEILGDFNAEKPKKVLVICNTIKKAREIYDALEDVPRAEKMLYHSQFTLNDKIEKERILDEILKMKGGFIAVCTQIVEVSLDIDFDVMYSENAPIDAIIQRLGRVNRKGSKGVDAAVIICRESEIARKWVYKGLEHILDLTFTLLTSYIEKLDGNLREKHFKELVDLIYTKENLEKTSFYQDISDAQKLVNELWEKVVQNLMTLSVSEARLNEVSSRKQGLVTVDCVMEIDNFKYDLKTKIENGDFETARKYTVKVALHIVKDKKAIPISDSGIFLLQLKYDSERGVYFEKWEDMCQC